MAPRSGKKSSGKKAPVSKRQKGEEQSEGDMLDALAIRLAQLGPRKWKLAELEAALSQAAGSLEDEGVRAHIQGNLQHCAAALHDRLQAAAPAEQQQEQPEQAAPKKRSKRNKAPSAAAAAAAKEAAAAEAAAVTTAAAAADAAAAAAEEDVLDMPAQESLPPTLSTAAGYRTLAAEAVEGQPDARFSPAALLLARRAPSEALVSAHVQRLLTNLPSFGKGATAEEQQQLAEAAAPLAASRAALGICSALSCEAAGPEDALRVFAPAVTQLAEAAQQLVAAAQQQQQQQEQQGEEEAVAAGAGAAAGFKELSQLAGRALASMHAALQQQRLGGDSKPGGSYWRANAQQPPAAAAEDAACAVSAALCTLLTTLRLHSSSSSQAGSIRKRVDALAAAGAADLRLLAPYAPSGQLSYLAGLPQEEACSSGDTAQRVLVLYGAAAKQEMVGEQDYLHRLAAARKAAAVAQHLGEEGLGAAIAAEASALPVSQDFVGWLQAQPPSSIVAAALAASTHGLDALSQHLVQECSERAMQGLLAAMRRTGGSGGGGGGGAAGSGEGGGEGAESDAAMDDLLFYADKEGDATMFGRDWHMEEAEEGAEEEEEEEEAGGGGLRLGALPGGKEDRRMSTDLGDD